MGAKHPTIIPIRIGYWGGGWEAIWAMRQKIIENCLSFHYNKTVLIKKIPVWVMTNTLNLNSKQ